ncbi:MAG: MFS transporter, partial [Planctomycetaceae bacterium]|nr:MFS transporter [Planctomycetaceae bacterium]
TMLLFGLLMLGGAGVGAFHPEAAVTAGSLLPGQRTRGLSIFMFGGALGLGLGPLLSGFAVSRWGFSGLAYTAVPLAAGVLLLSWIGGFYRFSPSTPRPTARLSLSETFEGRIGVAVLLLAVCSFRLVPNMGMDKVLSFIMQSDGNSVLEIGRTQSMFLASASLGMMLMAFRFRAGWEKPFLIGCPLAGIPVLYVLGLEGLPGWLTSACLIAVGMLLWGTSPAMVSYAQQLFPRGAGVASALTMGLSWGLGGLLQAPITAWFHSIGQPRLALWGFVPFLVLSAAGACLLPGSSQWGRATEADEPEPAPVDAAAPPVAAEPELNPASTV